ncbi:hypothetical protein P12x_002932 [Tundrisphaera lichenicola]|uniref:hypothetical protein n=1 Tax=Tundrisphaera lichenicola TaxID=2029860 RepID=UPI003EB92BC6
MANHGKKGDLPMSGFRYLGKKYKKLLTITQSGDARPAMHVIERAIHGLATGLLRIPTGVDPGDFIVSVGILGRCVTGE